MMTTEEKKTKTALSQAQANAREDAVASHALTQQEANAREGVTARTGASFDFAASIRDMAEELQMLALRVDAGKDDEDPLLPHERDALVSLKLKLKDYAHQYVAACNGKPAKKIDLNQNAVTKGNVFTNVVGCVLAIPAALFLLPLFAMGVVAGAVDGAANTKHVLDPRNRHEQNVANYFGHVAKSMGFGKERLDVDAIIRQHEKTFTEAFAYGVSTIGYATSIA